ncbi:MAG: rhomboid family intramembrane serine protease [Euryarchaeota archaeon]|nr:rhomboid family intramembrane serine protease [Euryarchaeota archaeon]
MGSLLSGLTDLTWNGHFLLPPTVPSLLILVVAVAAVVLAAKPGLHWGSLPIGAVAVLVAANVVTFILQGFPLGGVPTEHQWTTMVWAGLVPVLFLHGLQWWAPLTQMFTHGDLFHIFGNMLMLVVFGLKIEERVGRKALTVLYLASGLLATVVTLVAFPSSPVPNIGASGAVYGLIGFAIAAFPKEKVLIPTPIIMMWASPWVALVFYIGYNFLLSFGTNVAWWAHLAGMAVGLAWGYAWHRQTPRLRIEERWDDEGPTSSSYQYRYR